VKVNLRSIFWFIAGMVLVLSWSIYQDVRESAGIDISDYYAYQTFETDVPEPINELLFDGDWEIRTYYHVPPSEITPIDDYKVTIGTLGLWHLECGYVIVDQYGDSTFVEIK